MTSPVSKEFKFLLFLAERVTENNFQGFDWYLEIGVKQFGYEPKAIHDAIAVAAAFNMFNRYVDGINPMVPQGEENYIQTGEMVAKHGYINIPR